MIYQLGMFIYRTGFTTGMFIYPFLKNPLSNSYVFWFKEQDPFSSK